MRRAVLAFLFGVTPLASIFGLASVGIAGCDSSPARPSAPDAAAFAAAQGPWTRDAASFPVLDAAAPPTIMTDVVREPDETTTTLRLDLYGDYEETRGAKHESRRGHIGGPDLAAVLVLIRGAFDHAGSAPDGSTLRGEMLFELANDNRSERYDPQAPPPPLRALRERLLALTTARAGDELEIADCRHAAFLTSGVVVDDPKPSMAPPAPGAPAAELPKPKRVTPSPEAWTRFWSIVDSSEAWKWAPRYASERSSWTRGCARSAHLVHAGKRVDVHTYEAEPPNWDAVQRALQSLLEGP